MLLPLVCDTLHNWRSFDPFKCRAAIRLGFATHSSTSTCMRFLNFGCTLCTAFILIIIGSPTHGEDFNIAETHRVVDQWKLYNDVSEEKVSLIDVSTLDTDCSCDRHSGWILTTHSVVPQNRCVNGWISIGQTNDEVVGSVT